MRPHYDAAETKPETKPEATPRGWLERVVGGWLEAAAHPLLGWRRWLGGKCRQRQDAAWAQAVRVARLSPAAPRCRRPTEMVSLHTQPDERATRDPRVWRVYRPLRRWKLSESAKCFLHGVEA